MDNLLKNKGLLYIIIYYYHFRYIFIYIKLDRI